MDKNKGHGNFEADFFSSSPFLLSLAAFVRRELGLEENHGHGNFFAASNKPATLTSLSPEVLARLTVVNEEAANAESRRREGKTIDDENEQVIDQDWRINWSRVRITSDIEEGREEALAEGSRLAVLCHLALHPRQHQRPHSSAQEAKKCFKTVVAARLNKLPFARALPGVMEIILGDGSDEEIYVALCVCLTVLERELCDIYREGARKRINCPETPNSTGTAPEGREPSVDGDNRKSRDARGVTAAGPTMILRDLIATSEVKEALPEKMVIVLRLLLLPLGFNIRNLVWHGFLAPHELPRELASLVLVLTLSIPDLLERGKDAASPSSRSLILDESEPSPEPSLGLLRTSIASEVPDNTTASSCTCPDLTPLDRFSSCRKCSHEKVQDDRELSLLLAPLKSESLLPAWALSSFDDRLECPSTLALAVASLLSEKRRQELKALIRCSAFVFPGREDMVLLALKALKEGQYVFFLVAILPVLEHGIRCLFSCANDCPRHLFAQLRQYYSTLDGFGQRARHQLLLDQEMSVFPTRPNLLLAALGPGLSACLLDIFMMSAGPCLRGKVAHAEIDMSNAFLNPLSSTHPSSSSSSTAGCNESRSKDNNVETIKSSPRVVDLTAGVFLVLCRKYDPSVMSAPLSRPGNYYFPSPSSCDGFTEAILKCEGLFSEWVPRFHPHELLEVDLQAIWAEFNRLASTLERRTVMVQALPGGKLAQMSVVISGHSDSEDGVYRARIAAEKTARDHEKRGQIDSKALEERTRSVSHSRKSFQPKKEDQSLAGAPKAEVVLTITDSAHRLLHPPLDVGEGNLSLSSKGDRGTKKNIATTSGVFPNLFRVNEALRKHSARLACRHKRTTCRDWGSGDGPGHPSDAFPDSPPDAKAQHPGSESEKEIPSAFSVYIHSQRCLDVSACDLECLDGGGSSVLVEPASISGAKPSTAGVAAAPLEGDASQTFTDVSPFCEENRLDGYSKTKEGQSAGYVTSGASLKTEDRSSSARANAYHQRSQRKPRRISPPTNVITAVPLPQVACISGLCRTCAEVAQGLRKRIEELEGVLMTGAARSGQRRAYAATLSVTPTLLRFLASTAIAIEAFVMEWDTQHGGDGKTNAMEERSPPPSAADSLGVIAPDLIQRLRTGTLQVQPAPQENSADADQPIRRVRDFAPSLAFLRRLAAVNGALGLCVAGGARDERPQTIGATIGKTDPSRVPGNKGECPPGRKGYVQALAELASFLETKIAKRGFAGC